jgi:hypothetical protein
LAKSILNSKLQYLTRVDEVIDYASHRADLHRPQKAAPMRLKRPVSLIATLGSSLELRHHHPEGNTLWPCYYHLVQQIRPNVSHNTRGTRHSRNHINILKEGLMDITILGSVPSDIVSPMTNINALQDKVNLLFNVCDPCMLIIQSYLMPRSYIYLDGNARNRAYQARQLRLKHED